MCNRCKFNPTILPAAKDYLYFGSTKKVINFK